MSIEIDELIYQGFWSFEVGFEKSTFRIAKLDSGKWVVRDARMQSKLIYSYTSKR